MLKGGFWAIIGAVISRGFTLISFIIIARIFNTIVYGELSIIRSTINMFTVFASFGLGITATKYIAQFRDSDKLKSGRLIALTTQLAFITGLVLTTLILILAPFIAENSMNAPHLVTELRIASIIVFLTALNGAQLGILSGFEAFKAISKNTVISSLISLPIMLVLSYEIGLTGTILGLGLNFLILWILNYFEVIRLSKRHEIFINYSKSWKEWEILYKFSLPALLAGFTVAAVLWVINLMLVNQPNGYEEMAIFEVANQWKTILLFIPITISQIILPILSNSSSSTNNIRRILKISYSVNIIISIIFIIPVLVFSKYIMMLYGSDYENETIVLMVLILSVIPMIITDIQGKTLAHYEMMWLDLRINVVWGVVLIIISYFMLNLNYGAVGLAFSFIFSFIFKSVLIYWILNRLKLNSINNE